MVVLGSAAESCFATDVRRSHVISGIREAGISVQMQLIPTSGTGIPAELQTIGEGIGEPLLRRVDGTGRCWWAPSEQSESIRSTVTMVRRLSWCRLVLNRPSTANNLIVRSGDEIIPRSAAGGEGWELQSDSRTITIAGDSCDRATQRPAPPTVESQSVPCAP